MSTFVSSISLLAVLLSEPEGDAPPSEGANPPSEAPTEIAPELPTDAEAPSPAPKPDAEGPAGPTDAAPTDAAPTDAAPTGAAPTEPAPTDAAPTGAAPGPNTAPKVEPAPAAPTTVAKDAEPSGEIDPELATLLGETVIAAASRSSETSSDAPATTQLIRGEDLRRYGIRTLDEAFHYLSMAIHAELTGTTPDVGVRGVTIPQDFSNHILLLMDGHVVNEPSVGYAALDIAAGIPIELVDRIEIVYGPGSVMYGNNAMLAVVNVVTRSGESLDGFHTVAEGSWSPNQNRHGNFEDLKWDRTGRRGRVGLQYGRRFDVGRHGLDWVVAGEFVGDRSPKYEYGPQYDPAIEGLLSFGDKTGYDDPDIWGGHAREIAHGAYGYTKLKYEGLTLTGRGSWFSLTDPNSAVQFQPDRSLGIASSFADARYDYQVSKRVSGMARLYADHLLQRAFVQFPTQIFCGASIAPCEIQVDSESIRGGVENSWRFDWFADGRYTTTIGTDAAVRSADTYIYWTGADGDRRYEDLRYGGVDEAVGVYAQQIARVHSRIRFNVGARYDHFRYADAVSPRAAAMFDAWRGGTLKLIYSQAFRAPTVGERAENPSLKSEVVRSGEVSLTQAFGPHRLVLAGFGSVWDTIIQRRFETDPSNPGVIDIRHANANKIYGLGANLAYSANIGRWDWAVQGGYAYNRLRIGGFGDEDLALSDAELGEIGVSRYAADRFGRDQPLTVAPAVSGNARVAYGIRRGPTLAAVVAVVGPRTVKEAYQHPTMLGLVEQGADMTLPTKVTGRFTLSGTIAARSWFDVGYRFSLDWTSSVFTPHPVGPYRAYRVSPDDVRLELHQRPRLTVFGGFDLRFGAPRRSKGEAAR